MILKLLRRLLPQRKTVADPLDCMFEVGKVYKTRDGRIARVSAVRSDYIAAKVGTFTRSYKLNGALLVGSESCLDLMLPAIEDQGEYLRSRVSC